VQQDIQPSEGFLDVREKRLNGSFISDVDRQEGSPDRTRCIGASLFVEIGNDDLRAAFGAELSRGSTDSRCASDHQDNFTVQVLFHCLSFFVCAQKLGFFASNCAKRNLMQNYDFIGMA
jgi:hypothetical protein